MRLKYQENDPVQIIKGFYAGQTVVVRHVDTDETEAPRWPYLVRIDDKYMWLGEDEIAPVGNDDLQAENERLRTALNAISQEIVDWADFYKPLELNTTVALVARIEELVNEVIQ